MKKLIDVELPIFILIDEINNGNITADDLTKEQLNSLPNDIRKKALGI